MTRDERRAHLKTILDQYDVAHQAYERARWTATLDAMAATLAGMRALEEAQVAAMTAMREANRAALALFNEDEDGQ